MCGRYTYDFTWEELRNLTNAIVPTSLLTPNYNVAPTQNAPVVISIESGKLQAAYLKWGLIPEWAKDPKLGACINARAETVDSKPSFRSAFKSRRCLVPISGFYEWKKTDTGKQPFYIHSENILCLAGIWEEWNPGERSKFITYSIITTLANEFMASIHDRMPVIIDPANFSAWLDLNTSKDTLNSLLKPYPSEKLTAYPVSKLVNSPKNNSKSCLEPISN